MPNSLDPITDLTFGGVDLQRVDLSVHLVVISGLYELPMVRGTDRIVPHRTGRTFRSRVADTRKIMLEGYVTGQGDTDAEVLDDFAELMLLMGSTFDPTADPAALAGTLPNGRTISILARAVPPMLIDEVARSRAARLNIELESVVPDWTISSGGS